MKFPSIPSSPNFFQLQSEVLKYREENKIFEKSISNREGAENFTIFDGPPFKNGTPHYGHVLQSTIKDTIPRFWTMKGKRVPRTRGRDCHGIYIEQKVQKSLGLKTNQEIENFGVENFIKECYRFTNLANDDRNWTVPNIGRRVDMNNAYETMSNDYMESVWHVFKTIYDQNKIYKGKRVSMYSTKLNTAVGNFEVQADNSYAEINDPAITVKFGLKYPLENKEIESFEITNDGGTRVVYAIIKNDKGEILSWFNNKRGILQVPGGKVDKGETLEQALAREIREEIGCEIASSIYIGNSKEIDNGWYYESNVFEVVVSGEPKNQEPQKHEEFAYRLIEENKNIDLQNYDSKYMIMDLLSNIYTHKEILNNKPIYFLAWTTTPWTIPANIALVVNPEMDYAQVFDIKTQEYYILAHDLVGKYYKNPEDYIYIYKCKGSKLVGMNYNAPFDYYTASKLSEGGKSDNIANINNTHKVYAADYVTATDGTGIVHTAPEFGEEDFATGKRENLYQTNALNEEGRYTAEIYDMKGLYYRKDSDTEAAGESNANDEVMRRLTEKGLLFRKESITHTVPLCPRTQTPLIYKTQDSWFVDIDSIKPQLLAQNENINRVPNSVKYSRFAKSIETAPDRCISRTKYWATPMPVWIAKDSDGNTIDTKVMGSREDIYKLDQTGSKAINKYIYIRHGKTDYNEKARGLERCHDSLGLARLSKLGLEQADGLRAKILDYGKKEDFIFYLSPLPRIIQTFEPLLKELYGVDILNMSEYQNIYSIFVKLHNEDKKFDLDILKNHQYKISDNVYIDFRLTEEIHLNLQDEFIDENIAENNHQSGYGESIDNIKARFEDFISTENNKYSDKIVVIGSHGLIGKVFSRYFGINNIKGFIPTNAYPVVGYYNNNIGSYFDFHRPYIDSIWGQDGENRYSRTPEVLDPWMDSGSMPFAQLHYPFENADAFKDGFPADFIGEGAGQIRCRFQMMHNVSTLMTGKNAYKNVVVTGTVQGNDGRKMSKSFGNYPDIRPTIEKYGADSIRMMLLGSPLMAGGDLAFSEEGLKEVLRKINLPLRNSYSFFTTYANIDNFSPTKNNIKDFEGFEFGNDLDEWIISKLAILIDTVNTSMIAYDIQSAIKPIYIFMEDLTNRYIRRNRRRFRKSENDSDKMTGYDVLYVVLVELCKVLAPFMPFLPEYIYRNLTGNESVHLTDWTE